MIKLFSFSLLVSIVLFSQSAFSQYNETIRTARPGQAVGPFTTGKHVFQIQTGVTYGDFTDDLLDQTGNNVEYAASLRYGLLENFEIRSAFRWRSDQITLSTNEENKFNGISFWNVGIRYNIISGSDYQPSFGFQTDLKLTSVDEDYKAEEIAPRFMLIHGQKLSETFGLTTNWGIAWNGNNNSPRGFYVVNVSFPLSEKLGGFIENYGEISNSDLDMRWDTGLSYLVNNDFALDISGGFGSNEDLNDWFIDGGISWRIKTK